MELKEKQIAEAITRMQMLHLLGKVRTDFKRSGRVYYSERQTRIMDGVLYYLDNKPEFVELKKAFEDKYGALVYHCQLVNTNFGLMLSMLYVSENEEEWNLDRSCLSHNETYAYVCNLSCPQDSEIGLIGIRPVNGGITRTW